MAAYYTDYICHHGVKGMRWGIRKKYEKTERNTSSSKMSEERKKTIKKAVIAIAAVAGIGAAAYLGYKYNAVDKLHLSGLKNPEQSMKEALKETDDILFKKGTIFHRMEGYSGVDVTKKKGLSYMSYKPDDVKRYKALLKDWSGTGKRYDATYELLSDIRAPQKEKAREIFDQLWKNDPQYRIELTKTLTGTYTKFLTDQGVPRNEAIKQALQTVKTKFDEDDFEAGIYSFVRRSRDSEMFSQRLINNGYQAIEDYFDKGLLAESPMILLDPKSTMVKTGEKFVSQFEQENIINDLFGRGKIDMYGRMTK